MFPRPGNERKSNHVIEPGLAFYHLLKLGVCHATMASAECAAGATAVRVSSVGPVCRVPTAGALLPSSRNIPHGHVDIYVTMRTTRFHFPCWRDAVEGRRSDGSTQSAFSRNTALEHNANECSYKPICKFQWCSRLTRLMCIRYTTHNMLCCAVL